MSDQKIDIPQGTETVTLRLPKKEESIGGATLRQALLSTQGKRVVYVRVDEPNGVKWEVNVGPFNVPQRDMDDAEARLLRVKRFAECGMCDTEVLLDERTVTAVDFRDARVAQHADPDSGFIGVTAVVYEVNA